MPLKDLTTRVRGERTHRRGKARGREGEREGEGRRGREGYTADDCSLALCSPPDKVMYTVVTVGCPTAYGMKYRQGGLARMQAASSAGGVV